MEDEVSEHSTNSCWVRSAGKMPVSNILFRISWVQENERRERIVTSRKNYGCSSDCHSSIWLNLLRLSFDWTCITPDVPSRFLWSMQALFMNLVPPSSHFFFNSGPKRTLSLSLDVKCDQQTHKKMMSLIMESWSIPRFDICVFVNVSGMFGVW